MKIDKLVKVKWADACDFPEWQSVADIKATVPVNVVSVGYLIKKDKKCLVLAAHLSESGQGVGTMCIPRQNIIAIQKLHDKK